MASPNTNLDGNIYPRNWLRKETSHPLALSLFTNAVFSNDQKPFSWFIPIF